MKKLLVFATVALVVFLGFFLAIQREHLEPLNPTSEPVETVPSLILKDITLEKGSPFQLSIHEQYSIRPVAENLGRTRFMAWSPDGRLFVTDMHDLSDNTQGKIYILSGFNKATSTFATTTTYLSKLRNPNSIAFYKDSYGKDWLYIALTDKLIRYEFKAGDKAPSTKPETIAEFPAYGLSYKYGGWHLTRTIAFHNNKLYVSIGSSCNVCEEKEPERASILEMNPDGTNIKFFAKGLRNAVGLKWVGNDLFATNMGVDHLGAETPTEMFYKIMPGNNYGWPYCYSKNGKIINDTTVEWTKKNVQCELVLPTLADFDAHAAPLGLEFFDTGFKDQNIRGSFLVALHGSSDLSIKAGYKIVKVTPEGKVSDFITGFLNNGTVVGRPVDIIQYDSSSFFFTDDKKGVLYFVSYNP